jgi:hypothetical protein
MKLLKPTVALAAVALLAVPALAPGAGSGGRARQAEAFFVVPCELSHRAPDDPVVFPGRPGASHSHDFFGNRSTRATSTTASLLRRGTTCRNAADRAAYWVPTLLSGGRPVRPVRAQIYYRAAGKDPRTVRAQPRGLRIVAGSAKARTAQERRVTVWHCGPDADQRIGSQVPTCPAGRDLRLRVRFPDCWDGRNLDSPDHARHMAYARSGRCPPTHPVPVPLISMNVRYPIAGGPGVTLSSGGSLSGHADFMNAWRPGSLARMVRRCIAAPGMGHRAPCTPRRVRVAVSPRRLRAGRAVRVRVRVSVRQLGRVRPVRRALVRVGGRRVRSDRRGRASVVVRFRRPGRRVLRVEARDLLPRTVILRVR